MRASETDDLLKTEPPPAGPADRPRRFLQPWTGLLISGLVLGIVFHRTLVDLADFSLHSSLYSHIVLMPCISAWLIWKMRPRIQPGAVGSYGPAVAFGLAGLLLGTAGWILSRQPNWFTREDCLCLAMLSLLCLLGGSGCWFLGANNMKSLAFPLAFLWFMAPMPSAVTELVELALQHSSAFFTYLFLILTGTPFLYDNLLFALPGISIRVAQECSGIHSTLVLFITGLLASYMFLKSPGKRALLTLAIVLIGIVRNGFRIFTIAMLCVYIDPSMIYSPIHHSGGPVFFVLSLIPVFLVLALLRRSEKNGRNPS